MKLINKIMMLTLGVVALSSCEREYSLPPLGGATYDGPAANTTIAQLKQKTVAATKDAPVVISEDLIVKAYVNATDNGGAIFKQLIIQDNTGAIPVQVEQNSLSTMYPLGQEVILNMKGLCVGTYGDQQQIGIATKSPWRIPSAIFQNHISKVGFANPENVAPVVFTDFTKFDEKAEFNTFRRVELDNVYFEDGGVKTFFEGSEKAISRYMYDSNGHKLIVRVSSYANYANDKMPVGKGKVIGILSKFGRDWQLIIPSKDDVKDFDGVPVTPPTTQPSTTPSQPAASANEKVLLDQQFTTPGVKVMKDKKSNHWPSFKDMIEKFSVKGQFECSEGLTLRSNKIGDNFINNIWFNKDASDFVTLKDISFGNAKSVDIVVGVGANIYNAGESQNLNALEVFVGDKKYELPSTVIDSKEKGNRPEYLTIKNVAVNGTMSIKLQTNASATQFGLRLYSVKVVVPAQGGATSAPATPADGAVRPVVNNQ